MYISKLNKRQKRLLFTQQSNYLRICKSPKPFTREIRPLVEIVVFVRRFQTALSTSENKHTAI